MGQQPHRRRASPRAATSTRRSRCCASANGALGVVEMSRRSAWGYDIRTEVAGATGKVVVEAPHKTTAHVLAAVRLRGRPLRELPGPLRGGLPDRARGLLRGRSATAQTPTPGPEEALETLRLAVAARAKLARGPAGPGGRRHGRNIRSDGRRRPPRQRPRTGPGTAHRDHARERRLALPVVPGPRARARRDRRRRHRRQRDRDRARSADPAGSRSAGSGTGSPEPMSSRRSPHVAYLPPRTGVLDRRRRRVRGRDRRGAGVRAASRPAVRARRAASFVARRRQCRAEA